MKKIVIILGLIAACCAFTSCTNKAASDTTMPVSAEAPAPVPHDYKAEKAS